MGSELLKNDCSCQCSLPPPFCPYLSKYLHLFCCTTELFNYQENPFRFSHILAIHLKYIDVYLFNLSAHIRRLICKFLSCTRFLTDLEKGQLYLSYHKRVYYNKTLYEQHHTSFYLSWPGNLACSQVPM